MAKLDPATLATTDWTDLDLSDEVLVDATISDAQFQGTSLQCARFKAVRFVRCRFAHADLREAVFEDCVFADDTGHTGAQFAFSRLDEARFSKCDLSFARFERSSLYGIEMATCNLRGAVFQRADFGRSFGRNVVRSAAVFKACNLELADLSEARLPECELAGSSLREAVLLDADLEGADLRGCDFFQALTGGAKFARADLRAAEVSGLNILELASYDGLKIDADQQYRLLTALGLDVYAE
jgi:fluoroquinolone resistance protein